MKDEKEWFREWECRAFGAGYGSGELPILTATKRFFELMEDGRSYDSQVLEKELGATVTWLLINAFDKANMIEWGTSARYGWLTSCGEYLRDFITKHSAEELYEIVMADSDSTCLCDGEMHPDCGKNPFVNEKYADKLKYAP